MRFFGNYQGKEDGSIRFYDVKSKKTLPASPLR